MSVNRLLLDTALDDMRNLFGLHAVNEDKPIRKVQTFSLPRANLPNAIDDRTDGHTQCAAGAVVVDVWQMRVLVELDRLVARVGASHVALAAVDAHVLRERADEQVKEENVSWLGELTSLMRATFCCLLSRLL